MSNRRKPSHRKAQQPPAYIANAMASAACPDCDSDVSARYDPAGQRWHIDIAHDDHCPQRQWRERNGLTHQLAIFRPDGQPLQPSNLLPILEALHQQGSPGALLTFIKDGQPAAPPWQVRDIVDQLRSKED